MKFHHHPWNRTWHISEKFCEIPKHHIRSSHICKIKSRMFSRMCPLEVGFIRWYILEWWDKPWMGGTSDPLIRDYKMRITFHSSPSSSRYRHFVARRRKWHQSKCMSTRYKHLRRAYYSCVLV